MKFVCTVLYVFTVSAFLGSTLGDGEGGDLGTHTSAGSGPVCNVQLEENQDEGDMPGILMDRLISCIGHEGTAVREAIRSANTTEEYRNAVKGYCDNLPTIRACTADVNTKAEHCLNDTLTKSFKVVSNDLDTVLSVGCEEHGIRIATLVEEIGNLQNGSDYPSIKEKCYRVSQNHINDLDDNDASQVSVGYYRAFHSAKECFVEAGQGQSLVINLIDTISGDILNKLKCIHPESHAEVLCKSFVNN